MKKIELYCFLFFLVVASINATASTSSGTSTITTTTKTAAAVTATAAEENLSTTSVTETASQDDRHPEPDANVDWDSFGFGLNDVRTETMWLDTIENHHHHPGEETPSFCADAKRCLIPNGPLPLHPSSTVLSYGQSLFEGLKAFRRSDGSIALFRPDRNAHRMIQGAHRILLPFVPERVFVRAADDIVRSNAKWIPPMGKGALYLRPMLFGSGEALGVKPSPQATFCIYCSPVGNYFKGGHLKAIQLQAVEGYTRAAPGGSGSIKAGGNYAPAFLVQKQVRERGYDEALFLDALSEEAIEEAGASNFFAVFPNNTIVTPPLSTGTILPGVTRDSILTLAREECNCTIQERRLTIYDLEEASEAFCCGTGASITPVGGVNFKPKDKTKRNEFTKVFGDGTSAGSITEKLYRMLLDIQMGTNEALSNKYSHWVHIVHPTAEGS